MNRFAIALLLTFVSAPIAAADWHVEKSVPFSVGDWIPLEVTEEVLTLHRIRIAEVRGGITKSDLFRPGNTEFLDNIEIQLEFTNTSTRDWEAHLDVTWLDADGKEIDGYRDDESLDEDSRHDVTTVKLSTLKYGLARAKTLSIKIRVEPD